MHITEIFKINIERKKAELIRILGYQYFSEVIENSRLVTVRPRLPKHLVEIWVVQNVDSVVEKIKMYCEVSGKHSSFDQYYHDF